MTCVPCTQTVMFMVGRLPNRSVEERQSHPIDRYVGHRVRLRRTSLGVSQDQLARALGLTFQQIQKYENGTNRIGASRLFEISRSLEVQISYFFDEMPEGISSSPVSAPRGGLREPFDSSPIPNDELDTMLMQPEILQFVRSYHQISDKSQRKILLDLVKIMASDQDEHL
jgi:transcriptional regulator with XRE-family HTH domain